MIYGLLSTVAVKINDELYLLLFSYFFYCVLNQVNLRVPKRIGLEPTPV